MRVIIQPSYDLLSQWAANYVAKRINEFEPKEGKPFVLGLPTGSSPLGMYRALIELNKAGKIINGFCVSGLQMQRPFISKVI